MDMICIDLEATKVDQRKMVKEQLKFLGVEYPSDEMIDTYLNADDCFSISINPMQYSPMKSCFAWEFGEAHSMAYSMLSAVDSLASMCPEQEKLTPRQRKARYREGIKNIKGKKRFYE
jgi:hypothetical protein